MHLLIYPLPGYLYLPLVRFSEYTLNPPPTLRPPFIRHWRVHLNFCLVTYGRIYVANFEKNSCVSVRNLNNRKLFVYHQKLPKNTLTKNYPSPVFRHDISPALGGTTLYIISIVGTLQTFKILLNVSEIVKIQ